MPTIEMSTSFGTGVPSRMIRLGDGTGAQTSAASAGLLNNSGSSAASFGGICLMRGIPPTAGTFLANYAARSADVLCLFTSASNLGGNFQTSNVSTNPATISTEYVAATASGTATWFLWFVNQANTSTILNTTGAIYHQIIGTVGLPGTGNDLEIPNVNIVAGEQYRIVNLRVQFPTSWNY